MFYMNLLLCVAVSTILCCFCLAGGIPQTPRNKRNIFTELFQTHDARNDESPKQIGNFGLPPTDSDQINTEPSRMRIKQFPSKYDGMKKNNAYRQFHQGAQYPSFKTETKPLQLPMSSRSGFINSNFENSVDMNRKAELSREAMEKLKMLEQFDYLLQRLRENKQFQNKMSQIHSTHNILPQSMPTRNSNLDRKRFESRSEEFVPKIQSRDDSFPERSKSSIGFQRKPFVNSLFNPFVTSIPKSAYRPEFRLPFSQSAFDNGAYIPYGNTIHKLSPQSIAVESQLNNYFKKKFDQNKSQFHPNNVHFNGGDEYEKNSKTIELDFSEANTTDIYSELFRTLIQALPTRPNFQKVEKLKLIVKPPEQGNTTFVRDFMATLKNITTEFIPNAVTGAKLTAFKKDNDTVIIFQVTLYVKYIRGWNDNKLPELNNSTQSFVKNHLNDNDTEVVKLVANKTVEIAKINLAKLTSNYRQILKSMLFELLENSTRLHQKNESTIFILISLPHHNSFELTDSLLKTAQSAVCELAPEISTFVKIKLSHGRHRHAPRIVIQIPFRKMNSIDNFEYLNLTHAYENRYMEISSKVAKILHEQTKCQPDNSTITFNLTIILPINEKNHSIDKILREVTNILREFVPHHRIYVASQSTNVNDSLVLELNITMKASKILTYDGDRERRISINLQKPGSRMIQKIREVLPVIIREIKESSKPVSIIFNVSFPLGVNKNIIRSELFSLMTILEEAIPVKYGSIANVIFQITVIPTNIFRKNEIMRNLKFSEYENRQGKATTDQNFVSEINNASSTETMSQSTTESSSLYYRSTHSLGRVLSVFPMRPKITANPNQLFPNNLKFNFSRMNKITAASRSNPFVKQISEKHQNFIIPYKTSRYDNSERFPVINNEQPPLKLARSTIMNEKKPVEETQGPLKSFYRFLKKKYDNIKKIPHNLQTKIPEIIHTIWQTPYNKENIKNIVSRIRSFNMSNPATNESIFENEASSTASSNSVEKLNQLYIAATPGIFEKWNAKPMKPSQNSHSYGFYSHPTKTRRNIHNRWRTPSSKKHSKKNVSKMRWPTMIHRATKRSEFENEASSTASSNFFGNSNQLYISTTPGIFEKWMAKPAKTSRSSNFPAIPHHFLPHPTKTPRNIHNRWRTPSSKENSEINVFKMRWPNMINSATKRSYFENEASSTPSSNLFEKLNQLYIPTTPGIFENWMAKTMKPYNFYSHKTKMPRNIHNWWQTLPTEENSERTESKIRWPSMRTRPTRTSIFGNEASSTSSFNLGESSTTPSIFQKLIVGTMEPSENLYSRVTPNWFFPQNSFNVRSLIEPTFQPEYNRKLKNFVSSPNSQNFNVSSTYFKNGTNINKRLYNSFSTTPSSEIINMSNATISSNFSSMNSSVENTYQTLTDLTTAANEFLNATEGETVSESTSLENQTTSYEQGSTILSSTSWAVSEEAFTEFSAYNTTNVANMNNSTYQTNYTTSSFPSTIKPEINEKIRLTTEPNIVTVSAPSEFVKPSTKFRLPPHLIKSTQRWNERLKNTLPPPISDIIQREIAMKHNKNQMSEVSRPRAFSSRNNQILEENNGFYPSKIKPSNPLKHLKEINSKKTETPSVSKYYSENSIDETLAPSSPENEIIDKESSVQYYAEINHFNAKKRTLNLSELKSNIVNEIQKNILSELRTDQFEGNEPTVFLFKIIPPKGMMVNELRNFTEPLLTVLTSDLPNSEMSITTRAYYNKNQQIKLIKMKITLYMSASEPEKKENRFFKNDQLKGNVFFIKFRKMITRKILKQIELNFSYDQMVKFNFTIIYPGHFKRIFNSYLIRSVEATLSRILPFEDVDISFNSTKTNSGLISTLINIRIAPTSKSEGMTWSPLIYLDHITHTQFKYEISQFILRDLLNNSRLDRNISEVINFIFETNELNYFDIIELENSITEILDEMELRGKFLSSNTRLKLNKNGDIIIEMPFLISTTKNSFKTYLNSNRKSDTKNKYILPSGRISDLILAD